MLQQTQVERVIPHYEAFVARWPGFAALAAAGAADVVRAWRGLGYNSRALRLHCLRAPWSSATAGTPVQPGGATLAPRGRSVHGVRRAPSPSSSTTPRST